MQSINESAIVSLGLSHVPQKNKRKTGFFISSFYAYATTDLKIINSFLLQSVSYNDYLTL